MGVVQCPAHGREWLFLACEHVTRVLTTAETPPPYRLHPFDVGAESIEFWLCDSCAAAVGWNDGDTSEGASSQLWDRVSDVVRPSCNRCAAEQLLARFPPAEPAPMRGT